MKKNAVRIAAVLFAVFFLLGSGSPRTAGRIVEDLVIYRGCYGEAADAKADALLEELRRRDLRTGELWAGIMEYWDYVNARLPLNAAAPPENLPEDDSLCLIVLGFELNDDGTMKPELLGRLNAALGCIRRYPDAYVLCTGGGTAKEAPDVTEGRVMGDWLLDRGLSPNRLIVEDRSLTTAENALMSYRILSGDYPSVDSVVIVTSSYHVPWGALMFEAAFRKAAFESGRREIHVVSNCAFPAENDDYRADELLRWQAGGMLQLIGRNDLAREFYYNYDEFEKPPL